MQAKGTANDKNEMLCAAVAPGGDQASHLFAGAHAAFNAERHYAGAGRELGTDGIGLPGQRRVNLSLGRGIGQPFFLQLDYMEFTTPGKSFAVFFAGLAVKFFFQFSHTYERDVVHSCAPLQDMNGTGLAAGRHSQ